MLVVDGVELVALHQAREVRELHGDHARGCEQRAQAGHEVVQVRDVGQDVVADDQIGLPMLFGHLAGGLAAKEPDLGGDAALRGGTGDVGRGFDAEGRHAARDEVLQQVAVVARDLDHAAGAAEAEPTADHLDVAPGVLDPACRVRGEVGVLRKDLAGA